MFTEIKIEGFYGLPQLILGNGSNALGPLGKLNVIVGENSSGKTGILKLLYAVTKGYEDYRIDRVSNQPDLAKALAEKLFTTFMPRSKDLADLVSKGEPKLTFGAALTQPGTSLKLEFNLGSESRRTLAIPKYELLGAYAQSAIFLPPKEVLTIQDAIVETREIRKLPDFDDTYYDLVKCLRTKTTSGNVLEEIKGVSKTLEGVFKGKIVQQFENGKYTFIYKNGNQKYAMQQTAEGIKKIGILTTLINNRMLNNDTILFVDEPETALHPKAQRELVRILQKISQLSGAQVFIATHSYYIINQLHVVAMENKQMVPCISIVTNDKQEKSYDYYDLQKLMPNISIMKEALEMQSEELELIFKMNKQHPNSDKFSEEWN